MRLGPIQLPRRIREERRQQLSLSLFSHPDRSNSLFIVHESSARLLHCFALRFFPSEADKGLVCTSVCYIRQRDD